MRPRKHVIWKEKYALKILQPLCEKWWRNCEVLAQSFLTTPPSQTKFNFSFSGKHQMKQRTFLLSGTAATASRACCQKMFSQLSERFVSVSGRACS